MIHGLNEIIFPKQPAQPAMGRAGGAGVAETQDLTEVGGLGQDNRGAGQRSARDRMTSRSKPSLETRLRSISKELFQSMEAVLEVALADHGGTHRLRPVVLTSELGLDKSLASRIAKSLRENDELKALHASPSPKGLQLLRQALVEYGLSHGQLQGFSRSVDSYRELLLEFSGGRTGLEATLAGWIPELLEKAERDARRLVYRGHTTLDGTRTGTVYNAIYLQPPAHGSTKLDLYIVGVREDLRRLRPDEEIPLMVIAGHQSFGDWRNQRQRLDGTPMSSEAGDASVDNESPGQLLIEQLCSSPVQDLELVRRGESSVVRVTKASLDVNELATVAFGWKLSEFFFGAKDKSSGHHHISFTASVPAECMVVDLFVHQDVPLQSDPVATVSRLIDIDHEEMQEPPAPGTRARTSAPKVERLANSSSAVNTQDVRDCEGIAQHVSRVAGLDLDQFRVYRTRIDYPMTSEALTLWLEERT